MSELKAYTFSAMERTGLADYYLKSEADKVLAEKDAKILALNAEVFKEKYHAKLFFDERNYAEDQLRHNKYKRCLAMAKLCHWKMGVFMGVFIYKEEKSNFYHRWFKRWLKIADQLKGAK